MPKSDTFKRLIKASFRDLGLSDKLDFMEWCFNEIKKDLSNDKADVDTTPGLH